MDGERGRFFAARYCIDWSWAHDVFSEGKLPLGIHLLPLINLSDLEHIGDLPSLPESFEMAQV